MVVLLLLCVDSYILLPDTVMLSEQNYNYLYLDLLINVGATVSIQATEISITEGTSGEICIVLENGELERNVTVTLTTTAGTVGTFLVLYMVFS